MCRGVDQCTELADRETWSKRAPLPPPTSARDHILRLVPLIRAVSKGRAMEVRPLLAGFDDAVLREWGVEHGQMSGIHRHRALGKPLASANVSAGGPRNPSPSLARAVFERDRYHCRYCELPVIPREVFVAFSRAVGSDVFPVGRANNATHGLALLGWAQLDHVTPFKQGGATTLDNIVTSCWACNYGKDRFTIGQIGIDDPRDYPVIQAEWDGLAPLLSSLETRVADRPQLA